MALVLWLEHRKLPTKVKTVLKSAETGEVEIYIPVIVLAEIGYLSERKRIDVTLSDVNKYISTFKNFKVYQLSLHTILIAFGITDIPELHDRLIAGCSKEIDAELLTNDPIISGSTKMKTLWN